MDTTKRTRVEAQPGHWVDGVAERLFRAIRDGDDEGISRCQQALASLERCRGGRQRGLSSGPDPAGAAAQRVGTP